MSYYINLLVRIAHIICNQSVHVHRLTTTVIKILFTNFAGCRLDHRGLFILHDVKHNENGKVHYKFPDTFFVILHVLLPLMFIHF